LANSQPFGIHRREKHKTIRDLNRLSNSQPFGIHRREKHETIRDLNRLSNSQPFGIVKHKENNNWKRILNFQRIQNLLFFFYSFSFSGRPNGG
jgi:hypothetical protein